MISVVIPAYNEEKDIAKTLQSLVNQKTSEKFEVIVVDNASTDKTREVVLSFRSKLNLKVIEEKTKGRGVARATGCAKANGKIIFSVDADTWVPENWIDTGLKYFENKKVIAITGPWYIHDCSKLTNLFVNHFQKFFVLPYRLTMGHYWLTGLNFAVRKSAYIKSGGFNKTINSHEDEEITWRLRKLGKIVYANDFWVNTNGRRWRKGILSGLWSYQKTAFFYFVLKDKSRELEDKRE